MKARIVLPISQSIFDHLAESLGPLLEVMKRDHPFNDYEFAIDCTDLIIISTEGNRKHEDPSQLRLIFPGDREFPVSVGLQCVAAKAAGSR